MSQLTRRKTCFHFDMESATRPAAGFQKLSNQKQIDVQGGGELKQLVSHRARGQNETKLILNCKWSLGTVFPSDGSERGVCETSSCMSSEVCETNRLSLCCYLSVWLQDVNPVTSCSVCLSASRVRWGRVCPVLINRCVDLLTSGAWRRRVTLLKSAWKAIECHSDSFFFCSKLSRIYRFYFLLFCFWTNPQLCPPQVQLCLTEKRGCCQTVLASVQMCYLL